MGARKNRFGALSFREGERARVGERETIPGWNALPLSPSSTLPLWKCLCASVVISLFVAPADAAPAPGDTFPSATLTTSQGQARMVWKRGKIGVITFCAFWCDTWKPQSQRLRASQKALAGLPVEWTLVSVDGRWSDKGRGGEGTDLTQNALLDVGGHLTAQLGIHAVPTTLVVDETGRVLFCAQGIARSQTLLSVVRSALNGDAPTQGAPVRLVFDDFPSRDARLDDELLDILRARGVKATVCGSNARRAASPAIVSRARREGHTLSSPFLETGRAVVDPFDRKRPGRDELLRRVLGAASPGKTVLLHAGVRETVEALPDLLDGLRRAGL